MKRLIVRPEAESDLRDAFQWYEAKVPGLGAQFLLSLDATMASIQREPRLYPVLHKGMLRRALLRRFPYGVFFIEGKRNIAVIGVIHAMRNPQTWQERV